MVLDKVKSLIAEQMNIDESKITPESDIIKDLGADSLDIVEMLMNLESEWGIVIDDEDVPKLQRIKDVVAYIEEHAN
ncbi:MAG: acyl carrier protein [Clostridia bacterium]|nr:acyl carrier protein [Clostridia bacterium]